MKPYVLFVSLLFPAISVAQSALSQHSSVVSVRELAMPPKAARALEKGTALLLKNNPQASISYFQTVIALAPESFHAYHNVVIAHYRLGDVEDAEQEFQKSIELSKGSFAPSLFGLSMILYQRVRWLAEAEGAQTEPRLELVGFQTLGATGNRSRARIGG